MGFTCLPAGHRWLLRVYGQCTVPTYMGKPCSNYVSGLRPTALLLTGGVRPSVGGVSPVFRGVETISRHPELLVHYPTREALLAHHLPV